MCQRERGSCLCDNCCQRARLAGYPQLVGLSRFGNGLGTVHGYQPDEGGLAVRAERPGQNQDEA